MSKDFHREDTIGDLFVNAFGLFRRCTNEDYALGGRIASWLGMFWCVLRHGASPTEYIYLRFDRKNDRERDGYFTMLRFERFLKKVNTGDKSLFMNKIRFNQRFDSYLRRPWLDVDKATQAEFDAFIKREGAVLCKPLERSSGHGIFKYTYSPGDDLIAVKKQVSGMLLEHILLQHPEMAAFNPSCVNVPRLNTFLDKNGQPHLLSALFRSGIGDTVVDNLGSGGLIAHVDPDTGIVTNTALDLNRREYIHHPDSGKRIVGFQIPHWQQAKALALQAAREVPDIRWVGWDVAILPDGVCLIEGNDRADIRNLQYADRHGWRRQAEKLA